MKKTLIILVFLFIGFSSYLTNAEDINKLQMEALTKAGAFDNFFKDRKSIFESIPSLIS